MERGGGVGAQVAVEGVGEEEGIGAGACAEEGAERAEGEGVDDVVATCSPPLSMNTLPCELPLSLGGRCYTKGATSSNVPSPTAPTQTAGAGLGPC